MAARKSDEACIFCLPDPCSCATPPKKTVRTTAKPTIKSVPQATEQPKPAVRSGVSSVRSDAATAQEADERELRRALTVLCESGLVSSTDIEAHRADLNLTSTQIDVLLWKQRRDEWRHSRAREQSSTKP